MTPKQKNAFFIVLILAIVLVYTFTGGSVGISLDFGEDSLALAASGYDWDIPYADIVSLELTRLPDTGSCIDGTDRRSLACGTWENETWGRYTLCVKPDIENCIIITMTDGRVYVLNYENQESTNELHKMFTQILESKE